MSVMHPEHAAILFLTGYLVFAVGCIVWCIRRSKVGPVVWALYATARIYTPFFFHRRANRRSTIPATGPAIVVANHRSPVDPMLIWTNHHLGMRTGPIRVINFLMAREYYEVRGLMWLCRAMRSIPVERDGHDMRPAREALRRLQAGEIVGVFPEGRINTVETGVDLLPGDPGVAWLALRSRVPVLPIYIHNSPDGQSMVTPFYTPSRVFISYGTPIDLSSYYDRRISRELLDEVTQLMMRKLAETGCPVNSPPSSDEATKGARSIIPMQRAIG